MRERQRERARLDYPNRALYHPGFRGFMGIKKAAFKQREWTVREKRERREKERGCCQALLLALPPHPPPPTIPSLPPLVVTLVLPVEFLIWCCRLGSAFGVAFWGPSATFLLSPVIILFPFLPFTLPLPPSPSLPCSCQWMHSHTRMYQCYNNLSLIEPLGR